ncbi:LCP family protein [Lysinibacillus macroides]|uniref:Cell envelope-related transcriptional attenuator domain-containing protein n=1 Tax=Lysinibacillus macroides TaxID=33935 RepID=A0A0M9DF79_9BACI|nr:LCP family protein [Lysinibacillus macroides]KOY80258.1 hypothetical protein ADM90_20625 [Lysinibacillus macroides]QPR67564.1 LCP family protein [Lysinibacillus macroides]
MEDKRLRDKFGHTSTQELKFSKEDRDEVFEQIHKLEKNNNTPKKSFISSSKKFAPLTVSLFVLGLCIFLFMPSILSGNFNGERVVNEPEAEEAEYFTTLITVKSKDMDNRIYLNLLLTYSKDKKMMKVVSLPYDTYAQVGDKDDGTALYDKLLFAYRFGGAENVRTAVSKLFDLPIDDYAVIDLETISTLMDSMNGIEYDLQEDMRARAISQVAFEFKKGTNHLNGEQLVSLMMAATEGNSLDEEDLINLMNAIWKKAENNIPQPQLNELFTQIEANVSLDALLKNQIKINSIKSIALRDGMISDSITLNSTEGKHIYRFEQDFLNTISEELTTFN